MSVLYLKYIDSGIPILLHAVLCLLAYVFWSVLALLLAPVMCLFKTYKFFETSLIKYRKLGTVLCTFDVPFLHETENNRNFIVGMIRVKGEPNLGKLRQWVMSRLFQQTNDLDETYHRLSQRITKHYWSYVWEDEEHFNIKQHMKMYKGAPPKTVEDEQRMFENLAAEQIAKNISPWMFKVIPTHDKEAHLIFVKFHHTIGDGFAMVGLLSRLVDTKPIFANFSKSTRKSNMMANPIKRVVSGVITGPLAMLALVFSFNMKNPFRAKKTPAKKTVSWTPPISLKLVKNIKEKTGSTVNDVMMACLAGAIRRYISEIRQKEPQDFPIAMTFNSRSASAKLADTIPLGNKSGGLFLNLPVSISDPIKRLEKTKSRINQLKALSHPHLFSFVYFNVVGGLPETVGRFSTYSVNRHASMIVSNVPGPTEPIYIQGSPIESIIFTPPLHADVGMVASMFSYNQQIRMTIMSDKTIIKDLPRLTKFFTEEVQVLQELILLDD